MNQRLRINLNGVPLSQAALDLVPSASFSLQTLNGTPTRSLCSCFSTLEDFALRDSAAGSIALSHDGSALAYVDTGLGLAAYNQG